MGSLVMRWPFVSRTAYDTLSAIQQHQTAQFDALLERYHVAVTPKAAPAPLVAPEFKAFPPVVAAALAQATTHAPRDVARTVYLKARALLDAGGTAADVAAAVLKGESVELAD